MNDRREDLRRTAKPWTSSCHFQCWSKPDLTATAVSVTVLCIKPQLKFTSIVGTERGQIILRYHMERIIYQLSVRCYSVRLFYAA